MGSFLWQVGNWPLTEAELSTLSSCGPCKLFASTGKKPNPIFSIGEHWSHTHRVDTSHVFNNVPCLFKCFRGGINRRSTPSLRTSGMVWLETNRARSRCLESFQNWICSVCSSLSQCFCGSLDQRCHFTHLILGSHVVSARKREKNKYPKPFLLKFTALCT